MDLRENLAVHQYLFEIFFFQFVCRSYEGGIIEVRILKNLEFRDLELYLKVLNEEHD